MTQFQHARIAGRIRELEAMLPKARDALSFAAGGMAWHGDIIRVRDAIVAALRETDDA